MKQHTYKMIDIVGTSAESVEDAVRSGIARASKTLRGLSWFEVGEIRGRIDSGAVAEFQVAIRVGVKLEEE